MKTALVTLPSLILPGGNVFNTLHGYWNPPKYVFDFWSNGCKIEYIDDIDYENKCLEIKTSQLNCISTYYSDNSL